MGKGLALQFKNKYPNNFNAYSTSCKNGNVKPGRMFVFEVNENNAPRYIINFPTKRHWLDNSQMKDIDDGLVDLVTVIKSNNIRSIAIPPLGSGLGGLDWNEVRAHIEHALIDLADVQIIIFEPNDR